MNCFQHIPESRGAIAQPPRGCATKKKADPTTQHALIGFKHPHLPQPSALHNRTCPCPLTSDRTRNARAPTSPRSIGFCAIWDCISSSSSSISKLSKISKDPMPGVRRRRALSSLPGRLFLTGVRSSQGGVGVLARSRGARPGERGPVRLADCSPGFDGTTRSHTELLFIVLVPRGAVRVHF